MLAITLPELKAFMNQLLCTDTFDHFLLQEATIQGSITWNLNGMLGRDFFTTAEWEEKELEGLPFAPYGLIRPQCFDLIKGKNAPTYFKFVLLLSPSNLARTLEQTHSSFTPEDITGMFLNLRFSNGKLLLTTGISYRIFSADKSLEQEWDALVLRFLKNHGITFEDSSLLL